MFSNLKLSVTLLGTAGREFPVVDLRERSRSSRDSRLIVTYVGNHTWLLYIRRIIEDRHYEKSSRSPSMLVLYGSKSHGHHGHGANRIPEQHKQNRSLPSTEIRPGHITPPFGTLLFTRLPRRVNLAPHPALPPISRFRTLVLLTFSPPHIPAAYRS